jgi:hypothetical protein
VSSDVSPKSETSDPIEERLLIEEYKSCRDLIARNIDIIERTEVYAVGAAAASATFSLAATDSLLSDATCWIPLAISLLGLIRYIGIDSTIHKINNYLEEVERKYPLLGWTRSYRKQNKWKILKATRYVIWGVSVAASIGFAGYTLVVRPGATQQTGSPPKIDCHAKSHPIRIEANINPHPHLPNQ